ncbi:class I SAM-dependent methyltransferase [bacterium]|nr:class I SAM-dependent methyltransferase [bacterium]
MTERLQREQFFNSLAPKWMRDLEEQHPRLEVLFRNNQLPCKGNVLDVGTGTGVLFPHLLAGGSSSIVACDIARETLAMARKTHSARNGINYVRADAQALPFPDRSFNAVYCFRVFPHFTQPQRALQEFYRCLFPNGTLCIMHFMDHSALNAMHREAHPAVARDVLPPVNELANMLHDHGFATASMEEREGLYFLLATRK